VARDRAGLSTKRLKALFVRSIRLDRPLIDEFVGGNATCFWGR
jgi:poly(beta-D-mannuronate) lyase